MKPIHRLGFLNPSTNTTFERVATRMLCEFDDVSTHYSRFRVTHIRLGKEADDQFAFDTIVDAAQLVADAQVKVIGWHGTSGSWLGLDNDRELCRRITAATGIPAFTAALAFDELYAAYGVKRVGLVTPYMSDVQQRIVANYDAVGIETVAERHSGLSDNLKFGEIAEDEIVRMVRDVAQSAPDAISIVCSNVYGAHLAETLEAELGIPILDSVAVAIWKALKMVGKDTSKLQGWGQLFRT